MEEVFDSITWETPASDGYDPQYVGAPGGNTGPGYRQSTGSVDGRDPSEPKWEGFMVVSVSDPVKELPDTKDTYVSYLVSARVCLCSCDHLCLSQLV